MAMSQRERDDAAIRYLANSPEDWPKAVVAVAQLVPLIIKAVERMKRGDPGPDKLAGAVAILKEQEPWITDSPTSDQVREVMLSAVVAYLNMLTAARDA
jgi:hypothetical protein